MYNPVDRREITSDELAEARRYAIVIGWSPEDDAFVVSVPDIPGLHTHGVTREEAATMAEEAIAVWIAADRSLGIEPLRPEFDVLGGY
jgi:predicted RNase H-like HicB family nuclease